MRRRRERFAEVSIRVWPLVLAAVAVAAASLSAGGMSASAVATVRATVAPSVEVEASAPAVSLGGLPVGEFPATVSFRVRSNASHVALYVRASALTKAGGDRGDGPTIPLSREAGVTVGTARGDGSPGEPTVAHYLPAGSEVSGVPMLQTERVELPAGQGDDTYVTVTWRRDDPAQAAGVYRARVQLVALVLP